MALPTRGAARFVCEAIFDALLIRTRSSSTSAPAAATGRRSFEAWARRSSPVEPVRETADELRRRFRKDAGVKVVEKAVTASTEPVTLHINAIRRALLDISGLDRGDGAERPVLKVGIAVGRAPYRAGNYGRPADRRVWTTTVLQD